MATAHRIKGETTKPTHALQLVEKIGVTRASKEVGTSTTTLHKARKSGTISKPVELAAAYALEHLGDASQAPRAPRQAAPKAPAPAPATANDTRQPNRSMALLEFEADKADIVRRFAEALHAEIVLTD